MLSETTKSKCLDEMHYVCIISRSEAATEKYFLKIDAPNFETVEYHFTTVFKKYM